MITTHVLDTSSGKPARGVALRLWVEEGPGMSKLVGEGKTDDDGRCRTLLPQDAPGGTYRLHFDTQGYFGPTRCFYPHVEIVFRLEAGEGHVHVPLLISPFGFSTYRGS